MTARDDDARDDAERELKARIEGVRKRYTGASILIACAIGGVAAYFLQEAQFSSWGMSSPMLTVLITVGPMMLLGTGVGAGLTRMRLRTVVRAWAQEIAARRQIAADDLQYLVDYWEK